MGLRVDPTFSHHLDYIWISYHHLCMQDGPAMGHGLDLDFGALTCEREKSVCIV